MKRTIALLLIILAWASAAQAGKSYRMPSVAIAADLHEDGSMTVREDRSYRFRGRYRYAYRTFALDDRIEYADFQVLENGQPFERDGSEEPGTFSVTREEDQILVRWNFRARSEARTFTIAYTVRDAVHRHRDAAVLYYQFLGSGFKKGTGRVDIAIRPPAPVEDWQVRQWAHGPLWAESATASDGVVTAWCDDLPGRTFFELRVLYPPDLFTAAAERSGYISTQVGEEEAAWAEEANRRRLQAIEEAENLERRQALALKAMPFVIPAFVVYY